MTISYTWRINQLERDVADDYVTTVHYGVDATDGDHSQGAYGTVSFDKETSLSSSSFGTLDEATVLGWVLTKLNKEDVEAQLSACIELIKAPVSAVGMPWVVSDN